jgi:hypothetical protein
VAAHDRLQDARVDSGGARRASSVSLPGNSSEANARVSSYVDVARLDVASRRRVPNFRRGYPLAPWGHSPLGELGPEDRSRRCEDLVLQGQAVAGGYCRIEDDAN